MKRDAFAPVTASGPLLAPGMASLVVRRDSRFQDRFRAYQIILDGEKIGGIRQGKTVIFGVSPGQHTLEAQIDWCRSNALRFAVSPGGEVVIQVGSNIRRSGLSIFGMISALGTKRNSYLLLEQVNSVTR